MCKKQKKKKFEISRTNTKSSTLEIVPKASIENYTTLINFRIYFLFIRKNKIIYVVYTSFHGIFSVTFISNLSKTSSLCVRNRNDIIDSYDFHKNIIASRGKRRRRPNTLVRYLIPNFHAK